jgi:dihydrofolate synthase/folylpolyglutamate synthase
MPGQHQQDNAALAIAACEVLIKKGWKISKAEIESGISIAKLPGRSEIIAGNPFFILDIAHNEASMLALAQTLKSVERPQCDGDCLIGDAAFSTFGTAAYRSLIFAVSREKDVQAMLRPILPLFDQVLITKFVDNPRGREADEVAEIAERLVVSAGLQTEIRVIDTPEVALQAVRATGLFDHAVCITGSAFLVAELRPALISNS